MELKNPLLSAFNSTHAYTIDKIFSLFARDNRKRRRIDKGILLKKFSWFYLCITEMDCKDKKKNKKKRVQTKINRKERK